MSRRKGYTLVELIAVMGIALVVASLIGSLHLTITRAIETELARTEVLAGAEEVLHYLKRDVRGADAFSVRPGSLTVFRHGEAITYANAQAGVSRRSRVGSRLLGGEGITVAFSPLGGRGVQVTLRGERAARSRTITLRREVVIARRKP